MKNIFQGKPWVWIVVGFLAFVSAWGALIVIATYHKPEFIEVPKK